MVSQFVVAGLGTVPGLTALLLATVIFTKNPPIGRGPFGTLTFLMFPSMNLWPRLFIAPWIIGSATLLMPCYVPPSTQFSPHIKCYVPNTTRGCTPGVYLPTHLLTTYTHSFSPCMLLTLYSSKALVPGLTMLPWRH